MDSALLQNDNFDNFAEMLRLTPEIRTRLTDDESVALYDARLNFFWKRDVEEYLALYVQHYGNRSLCL